MAECCNFGFIDNGIQWYYPIFMLKINKKKALEVLQEIDLGQF